MTSTNSPRPGRRKALAVTGYDKGAISGVDITAATGATFTEPIAAFDKLGHPALRAIAADPARPRVTVPADNPFLRLGRPRGQRPSLTAARAPRRRSVLPVLRRVEVR